MIVTETKKKHRNKKMTRYDYVIKYCCIHLLPCFTRQQELYDGQRVDDENRQHGVEQLAPPIAPQHHAIFIDPQSLLISPVQAGVEKPDNLMGGEVEELPFRGGLEGIGVCRVIGFEPQVDALHGVVACRELDAAHLSVERELPATRNVNVNERRRG
jgi:hypothetical protein